MFDEPKRPEETLSAEELAIKNIAVDPYFKTSVIAEAQECGDHYEVQFKNGWSLMVQADPSEFTIRAGDKLKLYGRGIGFDVRGIVHIPGDGLPEETIIRYETPLERAQKTYDYLMERHNEAAAEEAENKAQLAEFIEPRFDCVDHEYWKTGRAANLDPYGKCCYDYAETWAALMDEQVAAGAAVADCAQEASDKADKKYGITGFMYGCAVSTLARCWRHGDELRRWHNSQYGRGNSDGVVNPAVMTIKED